MSCRACRSGSPPRRRTEPRPATWHACAPCRVRRRAPRVEELPGGLTNRNFKVTTATAAAMWRGSPARTPSLLADRPRRRAPRQPRRRGAGSRPRSSTGARRPAGAQRRAGRRVGRRPALDAGRPARRRRTCAGWRRPAGLLHAGPRFAARLRHVRAAAALPGDRPRARLPAAGALPGVHAAGRADRGRRSPCGRRRPCRATTTCSPANFIDDGDRLWLIDYEYAGNNDPCFELGNIWSESDLALDQLEPLVDGLLRPAACATRSPGPGCSA